REARRRGRGSRRLREAAPEAARRARHEPLRVGAGDSPQAPGQRRAELGRQGFRKVGAAFAQRARRTLLLNRRKEEVMTPIEEKAIDGAKLEQFVFRAVDEVGATLNTALVVIGDKLGLYRALGDVGPLTSAELAERTDTAERYVREWLNAQA